MAAGSITLLLDGLCEPPLLLNVLASNFERSSTTVLLQ